MVMKRCLIFKTLCDMYSNIPQSEIGNSIYTKHINSYTHTVAWYVVYSVDTLDILRHASMVDCESSTQDS